MYMRFFFRIRFYTTQAGKLLQMNNYSPLLLVEPTRASILQCHTEWLEYIPWQNCNLEFFFVNLILVKIRCTYRRSLAPRRQRDSTNHNIMMILVSLSRYLLTNFYKYATQIPLEWRMYTSIWNVILSMLRSQNQFP